MKLKVILFLSIVALIFTGCSQKEIEGAVDWPVGNFSYMSQDGESFGSKNLEGKIWIANFVFTKCVDVCPPMTFNMKKLQQMAKKENIENIEFVSFSVDPTVDTPNALTAFGEHFGVDFTNWHFLTGYKQEEIEKLAMEKFKTLVKKPQQGDQVIHGTDFYLVSPDGKIQKQYSGLNDIPFEQILKDIKTLQ